MKRSVIDSALGYMLDTSGARKMSWQDLLQYKRWDFVIRTKSGKEYPGTVYDAMMYIEQKDRDDNYEDCFILFTYGKKGSDLLYIAYDSMESIHIRCNFSFEDDNK